MEFAPGWSLGDVGVDSPPRFSDRSFGRPHQGGSRRVEPVCYGDVGVDSPSVLLRSFRRPHRGGAA
eukprot:1367816-Heterocapsa_arctica.AAC.1